MNLYNDLNPQQQQAVMTGTGPILVLAGPGSGKTRVLTRRIAHLIGYAGVSPFHLLAVTFTNKAAREMENRVIDLLGESPNGLTLGTFHSICARLLRREADNLPFKSNFVIFDEDDQMSLVRQALRDLNLDEKKYRPASIHNAISTAKNELILPDELPIQSYKDEIVRRVYRRYQELILASNALDFDDLLLWTVFLFEENSPVRDRYARRYEHVLVDEFQDTNLAQYRLLKHLTSFHSNIFVVGDADQSIYRWRGADYRNVLRFEKDFPDAQIILLEQNYRSTQSILDVATVVIDRNPQRIRKQLFTNRGQGQKATLYEAYDDRLEAAYVVETILSSIARGQARPGDFAVMYRTNAQSRLLEEAFLGAGLPYKLVGAQRFYGRREIKDLVSYLRLVHNPSDEVSLSRVINTPSRGIGDKSFMALRTQAQKAGMSTGEFLLNLRLDADTNGVDFLSGRARASTLHFSNLLRHWTENKSNSASLILLDQIIDDTEYHNYIDDGTEEGHERWDNILELRRLAAEFPEPGLEAFLERVALVSDQDTLAENPNSPTLLTLHAAKGLEFTNVFITGLIDGVLPHSRSFDDPEAMLEERRLFYVGITRAKDLLYLVHPQNRSAYGYQEPVEPSRYLWDIPNGLLADSIPDLSTRQIMKITSKPGRWEPGLAHLGQQSTSPRYFAGMIVIHPAWGEGMVLNSRYLDGDEIVDIQFEQLGLKRVVASLANLEIKSIPEKS